MSDMGITEQQALLLGYIKECLATDGIGPSFEEMMMFLGLRSKSGVHRIVTALERRGHIHRIRCGVRAIGLGPEPVQTCPHCRKRVGGFTAEGGHPLSTRRSKYPLDGLTVGESFFVHDPEKPSVAALVSRRARAGIGKYSIRKVEGGYRCWRVA